MQQTVHEHLRQRLWEHLVPGQLPDLAALRQTEWCSGFEQFMRNRLIMGRIRYGQSLQDPQKAGEYDCLKAIENKLLRYRESGNLEYLVDMANYCLIEFVHSKHLKKHFSATDDVDHCPTNTDAGQ